MFLDFKLFYVYSAKNEDLGSIGIFKELWDNI